MPSSETKKIPYGVDAMPWGEIAPFSHAVGLVLTVPSLPMMISYWRRVENRNRPLSHCAPLMRGSVPGETMRVALSLWASGLSKRAQYKVPGLSGSPTAKRWPALSAKKVGGALGLGPTRAQRPAVIELPSRNQSMRSAWADPDDVPVTVIAWRLAITPPLDDGEGLLTSPVIEER